MNDVVVDGPEADLADAKQSLEELEAEAAGIQNRVTEAALAGDAEGFVAAQIRRVALPVLVNRAAVAVVEAELAIVREQKRDAYAELEGARARYETLHARRFTLSPSERKALGKAEAPMRTAQEKLRPVEAREHELCLRKAALEEASRSWPSHEDGAWEGGAA